MTSGSGNFIQSGRTGNADRRVCGYGVEVFGDDHDVVSRLGAVHPFDDLQAAHDLQRSDEVQGSQSGIQHEDDGLVGHGATSRWLGTLYHVEAEHHPGLVVLGDVAVCHPPSGIAGVDEDVDDFAGADQDGVLPGQIGFRHAAAVEHQEPAGAVERVMRAVVGSGGVVEADLDPVA